MKKKTRAIRKPIRSQQVPATTAMLYEMEERLTSRMDAGFESLRSEFKSDFGQLKSELHRVALLVEEQNARNKYVMDGYAPLYELLANRA
jgi:hypothetical protein